MPVNNVDSVPIQTYQRSGKMDASNKSGNEKNAFDALIREPLKDAIEASRTAEKAVSLRHNGQISQEEYLISINEAAVQLSFLKTAAEKMLSAVKEAQQATTS